MYVAQSVARAKKSSNTLLNRYLHARRLEFTTPSPIPAVAATRWLIGKRVDGIRESFRHEEDGEHRQERPQARAGESVLPGPPIRRPLPAGSCRESPRVVPMSTTITLGLLRREARLVAVTVCRSALHAVAPATVNIVLRRGKVAERKRRRL